MYAPFWKRAVAALLDLLVIASIRQVSVILSVFIMYSITTVNNYKRVYELLWIFDMARGVLVLLVLWSYFAIMESSKFQATFGKMAVGLRVVDREGKKITFRRATARFWSKSLSAITVLIGWFIAGFTKKKQALHDLVAGTCLIEEEILKARQVETTAAV